jgi:hypothetical protein
MRLFQGQISRSAAVSHHALTTVLTTTMTTVGLPDTSTYTTIKLASCLVTPPAHAYGSEGSSSASMRCNPLTMRLAGVDCPWSVDNSNSRRTVPPCFQRRISEVIHDELRRIDYRVVPQCVSSFRSHHSWHFLNEAGTRRVDQTGQAARRRYTSRTFHSRRTSNHRAVSAPNAFRAADRMPTRRSTDLS